VRLARRADNLFLMSRYARFRYLIFLPFAVFFFGTWLGGYFLNTVDARGVVIDDTTNGPVGPIVVNYGQRAFSTGDDSRYELFNLPRGAQLKAQKPGYGVGSASAEASELRLTPVTLTFQVWQEGTDPKQGVPNPELRQGTTVLGKGTDTGSVVAVPYPDRSQPVLVCAIGYDGKNVDAKGVTMEVTLHKNPNDPTAKCPDLPSPSPSATPTGAGSPAPSGSAAPSPSPAPTPSPTKSP
jgi:hypothetical protein